MQGQVNINLCPNEEKAIALNIVRQAIRQDWIATIETGKDAHERVKAELKRRGIENDAFAWGIVNLIAEQYA